MGLAGGELQGWYRDPFGRHEQRYFSGGRPTKLVRDGHVESYDEPSAAGTEMPAGEPGFAAGGAAGPAGAGPAGAGDVPGAGGAPGVGGDRYPPGAAAWSPWRWYGRAIAVVVVIAAGTIFAVIEFGGGHSPSWAQALGAGVTVDAPAPASPGHGSPGAAVAGFIGDIAAKNLTGALCDYGWQAGVTRAECTSLAALGTGTPVSLANFALGYTAVDGGRALVGTTGTICSDGTTCETNRDPAAILSGGKPFGTLWTQAVNNSGNAYSLIPCVEQDGSWYVDLSPS
jgi:hypothetical protein